MSLVFCCCLAIAIAFKACWASALAFSSLKCSFSFLSSPLPLFLLYDAASTAAAAANIAASIAENCSCLLSRCCCCRRPLLLLGSTLPRIFFTSDFFFMAVRLFPMALMFSMLTLNSSSWASKPSPSSSQSNSCFKRSSMKRLASAVFLASVSLNSCSFSSFCSLTYSLDSGAVFSCPVCSWQRLRVMGAGAENFSPLLISIVFFLGRTPTAASFFGCALLGACSKYFLLLFLRRCC
mmetsp:Transcript_17117/g.35342  ORF Transcript_17117/g.35342 Transcript_17117/m.35342 type:complete len:237 (-) Transcript_17117:445-1155(-)